MALTSGGLIRTWAGAALLSATTALPGAAHAQGEAGAAPDYSDGSVWLCRPGREDACAVDLDAAVVQADGSVTMDIHQPAQDPAVDCFYVYPTVSVDPGVNSDLEIGPEERGVVHAQFARFSEVCRPFAPLYRQVTLTALRAAMAGNGDAMSGGALAYGDVRDAWRHYLEHDNEGRGVILVGHSQGARMLQTLINQEIEGEPVQDQVISAYLIGWNVQVPEGETVGGIVVMRYGENALAVIERVKQRLEDVQAGLPEGVEVVTTYDRSNLIQRAIDTLTHTLIVEMVVVALVIFAFLLHVRSALVACVTLPIAILLAFIPLKAQGLTANIMSLGGIAVAIGAMVDAAVVMVDNIHKRLGAREEGDDRKALIISAMQDVGPSIFFSLLIITLSFIPVFSLQATEGRLFSPLAYTKTYSMGFAAILAVTLIPALAVLLIRGRIRSHNNPVNRVLVTVFLPAIRFCIHWRWPVVGLSVLALVLTVPVARQLGNEFMPPLNEGSILYMPTALPGMSITEAGQVLQRMDKQLKAFPEVERVFGKVGRSTSATDPAPLSMVETVITLKPRDQWREGVSWDDLIAEMDEKLRYPGMPNIWWMPIQTRTEMLATGIRSALGIKVFGDSLAEIENTAVAIEKALQADPRTADDTRSAFAERLTGGYFIDFDIDRPAAARYGLNVQDVQDVLMAAMGGVAVTQTVEGRERYNVQVRYDRSYRQSIADLERLLIPTPTGATLPITEVADIAFRTGAPMIRNEDGQLVGFVFVDLKSDVGVADYVAQAKDVVADKVALPSGYRLGWAGQFQYFERAKARLQWVVPATLLAVFLLLYLHRGRLSDTLFVLSAMPFALIGAVWLLFLLDYKLSVAVWVGMIALAGLAAEMGLLMLHYLDGAYRQACQRVPDMSPALLCEEVAQGAVHRIRPMLMTSLTLLISLIPVMLSDGTGADVMKRIAAPMVGGTITALIVVLLVFPALFVLWKQRSRRH